MTRGTDHDGSWAVTILAVELTRTATRLFRERGYDEVTVDDTAAAADVSPRTFYRYFPSKEDVVLGDVADGIARFKDALAARPEGEPVLESIRAIAPVGEPDPAPRIGWSMVGTTLLARRPRKEAPTAMSHSR